ncbi:MAG: hypothetical protein LBL94_02380 [Prevotellaceae bacterium]|jgi:hypothetical protein|nr:hypothetical protein [Prevotellaceae bacterium]
MKILFFPEVEEYLFELAELLYRKDYFGFKETARQYVIELVEDIVDLLPTKRKRQSPPYFDRYGEGMFYAVFKKRKHTQWYVFFNICAAEEEAVYLVRYISNNHMSAHVMLLL